MKRLNLENKRFGKLVALRPEGRRGTGILWRCRCDCGNENIVSASILNIGKSTQCLNCARKQNLNATKHGMSYSPEYRSYRSMLSRCYDPNVEQYPNYGGRGIKVCDEWKGEQGFNNFFKYMGFRPSANHSLDREDSDEGYGPDNCKWSTKSEQSKNRRPFVAINNQSFLALFNEIFRRCAFASAIS